MVAIGIDSGGKKTKAALVDKKKVLMLKSSVSTHRNNGKDSVFEKITDLVKDLKSLAEKKSTSLFHTAKARIELALIM